jgi:hypothetical protein
MDLVRSVWSSWSSNRKTSSCVIMKSFCLCLVFSLSFSRPSIFSELSISSFSFSLAHRLFQMEITSFYNIIFRSIPARLMSTLISKVDWKFLKSGEYRCRMQLSQRSWLSSLTRTWELLTRFLWHNSSSFSMRFLLWEFERLREISELFVAYYLCKGGTFIWLMRRPFRPLKFGYLDIKASLTIKKRPETVSFLVISMRRRSSGVLWRET